MKFPMNGGSQGYSWGEGVYGILWGWSTTVEGEASGI